MRTYYTDGGCQPNPGNGTWAFVCIDDKTEMSGFEKETTNNRMELMAVMTAVKHAMEQECYRVVIYSDSQYCVNSINQWIIGWERKAWKGKKNVDLFKEIFELKKICKIEMRWVRGHDGDTNNERCDALVREEYEKRFAGEMKF